MKKLTSYLAIIAAVSIIVDNIINNLFTTVVMFALVGLSIIFTVVDLVKRWKE